MLGHLQKVTTRSVTAEQIWLTIMPQITRMDMLLFAFVGNKDHKAHGKHGPRKAARSA